VLEDTLRLDPVDHDQLRPARGAGDEANIPLWHAELVGDESQQGLVCGTLDCRCGDTRAKHAVRDAIDAIDTTAGREADGKADVDLAQGSLRARRA